MGVEGIDAPVAEVADQQSPAGAAEAPRRPRDAPRRVERALAREAASGTIDPDSITEETVSSRLYTADCPDPDLLIRTSGEQRISNFLLWQLAYAELYITPVLWPDFSRRELWSAIEEFQRRDRRYGRVTA